jgi:NAD(P)-dependent dehydrogenase (short-subunit alcohol dehydrogenase family)
MATQLVVAGGAIVGMTKRLQDKVALVFGAGSSGPGWGNGKAAAVEFAREGARVVAVDLKPAAAEETGQVINGEGGKCLTLAADVTNSESVKRAVDAAIAEFGRIDVLHNNVGVAMGGPVELTEDGWRKAIDVNLTSVYLTCKHVLPIMSRQVSGAIVNVSSLAAIRYTGYPYFAYYAAKAGVNQATVAIALQYAAQGIRANAIMPGFIDTPLIHSQIAGQYASSDEMIRERNKLTPMGRMGTAWDIAKAAVFLASDDAQYITGVCLAVDGGVSARIAG